MISDARKLPFPGLTLYSVFFLAALFMVLDGLNLVNVLDGKITNLRLYSDTVKLMISFIISLSAFSIGASAYDLSDKRRLNVVFVFIILADIFFYLRLTLPGVLAFILMQLSLVYRNSRGLAAAVKQNGIKKLLLYPFFLTAVFTGSGAGLLLFFCDFNGGDKKLLFTILIYCFILSFSLFTGLTVPHNPLFIKPNAGLAAGSVVLFFACDVSVGMELFNAGETGRAAAVAVTWLFYTPALLLLFLSGLKWKSRD